MINNNILDKILRNYMLMICVSSFCLTGCFVVCILELFCSLFVVENKECSFMHGIQVTELGHHAAIPLLHGA